VKARLANQAVAKVIELPINTYQVQAILVPKKMYNIEPMLISIPIKAGGWLTRRKNAPTKKTPKTGPLIKEAIESA
jgi:hypothetical protein